MQVVGGALRAVLDKLPLRELIVGHVYVSRQVTVNHPSASCHSCPFKRVATMARQLPLMQVVEVH